jgi:hypothetical protein
MRIWKPLCCLALGALALAAAVALVMTFRSNDLATPAKAQSNASMQLDMDPNNGSGPCNPVDASVSVGKGSEYEVAICLTGADEAPSTWEAHIDHDDSVGQCVPTECPDAYCLDGNPDANAGSITWGTSLGSGWDCSIMGILPAQCKDPNGQITIDCISILDPGTLPVGPDVSSPLAIIKFKAAKEGTDRLSFSAAVAAGYLATQFLDCSPDSSGSCEGGSVEVGPPGAASPTPIETVAPGETVPPVNAAEATATAVAAAPIATAAAGTAVAQGTPIAAIDQAATATSVAAATKAVGATKTAVAAKATAKPSTSEKSSDSSGPSTGLIVGIVIAAAIVVGGTGWFAFRRLRRS